MNWGLRIFAAVIDILQLMVFVVFTGLQMITPAGGAGVGGIAGGAYCWYTSSNFVTGAFNAAWCAVAGAAGGGLLSTFAIPLGMAIDFAISLVLGSALILGLLVAGKYRTDVVIQSFLGETLPFLNFLPFWSIMVHRSFAARADGSSGGIISTAFGVVSGSTTPVAALAGAASTLAGTRFNAAPKTASSPTASATTPAARAPQLNTRIRSDIRPPAPANNNAATSYAKTA